MSWASLLESFEPTHFEGEKCGWCRGRWRPEWRHEVG